MAEINHIVLLKGCPETTFIIRFLYPKNLSTQINKISERRILDTAPDTAPDNADNKLKLARYTNQQLFYIE